MTPLHMALYKQHDEAVVMAVLAAHPASTAACDEDGDTPLHLAVYKRHSANVVQVRPILGRDQARHTCTVNEDSNTHTNSDVS
jgi:ankyrin repeat protein